ncbi:hypothetical protein BKA70DRAFT_1461603 [Coprinopsis sp. MPI-PUGE-AT-0042]|nr:hypothetical protein BKA70DRAFT_1461603 [Coprinopsis sp. MPI-PUGE-AT-0042]
MCLVLLLLAEHQASGDIWASFGSSKNRIVSKFDNSNLKGWIRQDRRPQKAQFSLIMLEDHNLEAALTRTKIWKEVQIGCDKCDDISRRLKLATKSSPKYHCFGSELDPEKRTVRGKDEEDKKVGASAGGRVDQAARLFFIGQPRREAPFLREDQLQSSKQAEVISGLGDLHDKCSEQGITPTPERLQPTGKNREFAVILTPKKGCTLQAPSLSSALFQIAIPRKAAQFLLVTNGRFMNSTFVFYHRMHTSVSAQHLLQADTKHGVTAAMPQTEFSPAPPEYTAGMLLLTDIPRDPKNGVVTLLNSERVASLLEPSVPASKLLASARWPTFDSERSVWELDQHKSSGRYLPQWFLPALVKVLDCFQPNSARSASEEKRLSFVRIQSQFSKQAGIVGCAGDLPGKRSQHGVAPAPMERLHPADVINGACLIHLFYGRWGQLQRARWLPGGYVLTSKPTTRSIRGAMSSYHRLRRRSSGKEPTSAVYHYGVGGVGFTMGIESGRLPSYPTRTGISQLIRNRIEGDIRCNAAPVPQEGDGYSKALRLAMPSARHA